VIETDEESTITAGSVATTATRQLS
jgi:hypothetical protein